MIGSIIAGSIKNRIIVLIMAILLGFGGYWSYKNMPLDAIQA
jgi:Cu/Ag efflux pump CusA